MKYLVTILVLFSTSSVFGQSFFSGNESYIITPSVGILYYKSDLGFVAKIDFNIHSDGTQYKTNLHKFESFQLFEKTPEFEYWNFNVFYGKYTTWKAFTFSVAAGVGIISGTKRGKFLYTENKDNGWFSSSAIYEKNNFTTLNLPIEATINFNPFKYFGLNLNISGNLNSEIITYGYNFGFNIIIP